MSAGILAFGGYVPRLRLQRRATAEANAWFNPALMGLGKGERAIAGWDEDAVTMAVEAARDCLAHRGRDGISHLFLATRYFCADRHSREACARESGCGQRESIAWFKV